MKPKSIFSKILVGVISTCVLGFAIAQNTQTDIYLKIYNTYTGSYSFGSNDAKLISGIYYTNLNPLPINLSCNTGNITYIISGGITNSPDTGYEANSFIIQNLLNLTPGDGIKQLKIQFHKSPEVYIFPKINIYLDTTPPSKPIITTPTSGEIVNGIFLLSRSASTDAGAGIREYEYYLSHDSGFSTVNYFGSTPNNETLINANSLGTGTYYVMIIARDEANNARVSDTSAFCSQICSNTTGVIQPVVNPPTGGGGGGGGGIVTKWITITEEEKQQLEEQTENIIAKPDPKINVLAKLFYEQELIDAYKYAYSLGITTMPTIMAAEMKSPLLRKHLAKMVSEYAIKVLDKKPDNGMICSFQDIDGEDIEMRYYMRLACKLNLMGLHEDGIRPKNVFDPNLEVTRAEFGTVFSRLLYGNQNNVKPGEIVSWFEKHLQALKNNEIMKKINEPFMKELRGWVMTMMMRADPIATQRIGGTQAHTSSK